MENTASLRQAASETMQHPTVLESPWSEGCSDAFIVYSITYGLVGREKRWQGEMPSLSMTFADEDFSASTSLKRTGARNSQRRMKTFKPGAHLTQVAVEAGIELQLVRIRRCEPGDERYMERVTRLPHFRQRCSSFGPSAFISSQS